MRRRQEMEREAAATFMSKKTGDGGAGGGTGGGSTQRLDEPTLAGRMTRQNTADDRATVNKAEVNEKQKLRFVKIFISAKLKN